MIASIIPTATLKETKAAEIHNGASTHTHDQSMTPTSLRIINVNKRSVEKENPPPKTT